jgi:hypothetical protein
LPKFFNFLKSAPILELQSRCAPIAVAISPAKSGNAKRKIMNVFKHLVAFSLFGMIILPANASGPEAGLVNKEKGFIENKGQLINQNGRANQAVKYLWVSNKRMNVQLKENAFSYEVYEKQADNNYAYHRMDVEFINSKPRPEIMPGEAINGRSNYYSATGNGVSDVKAYRQLVYDDLYKGIDFIASSSSTGQFKYDFKLENSSSAGQIKMKYSGFDNFELKGNDLVFTLSGKELTE